MKPLLLSELIEFDLFIFFFKPVAVQSVIASRLQNVTSSDSQPKIKD